MKVPVAQGACANFATQSAYGDLSDLHVGIIMDGNGRWATRRGLPRLAGHNAGIRALRETVTAAGEMRLGSLTVYAFSSDNWSRPRAEVAGLMGIMRRYFAKELTTLIDNGIKVSAIGRRDRLDDDIQDSLRHAEQATRNGDRLHLRVALDYSGRHAIAQAAARLASRGEAITQVALGAALSGDDGPDKLDLLIRSGGEQRLSDFMIWEAAYAEFVFTDTLWPDFGRADLVHALGAFAGRERRFGGLPNTGIGETSGVITGDGNCAQAGAV